jgi:hypothetical protein
MLTGRTCVDSVYDRIGICRNKVVRTIVECLISIGSLAISITAILLSITTFCRSTRQEEHSARTEALNLALNLEMTLVELYSSVLTLDQSAYSEEVSVVIDKSRSDLPNMISNVASMRN